MKDKISIVIPIYNCEKYLKECINSIFKQTYTNIEILLIDDGSTDSSGEICDIFAKKDSRIKVYHKKNGGVSSARNFGIDKCSGNYVTFIDADDTICEKYVEYLYKIIVDNNADISLTRSPMKFNSKTVIKKIDINNDNIEIYNGVNAAREMLLYKIVISSWNKMFSCKLLNDNNIRFNEKLAFGEGFEFVINCFLHAKKVSIGNAKIYNYRVDNQNSVMTKFSRKLVTGSMDSQNSIYSMIDDLNNEDNRNELFKCWKYSNWHTNCDCLNTILGCNVKKDNKDLFILTRRNCRKYALSSLFCEVPTKDRIKTILYFISPVFAGKVINKFRIRKYTKE